MTRGLHPRVSSRVALALALVLVAGACERGQARGSSTTTATAAGSARPTRSAPPSGGACPEPSQKISSVASLPLTDTTAAMGADEPLRGMYGHAAATADVNADGWLDLFVGTFADKPAARYQYRGATGPSPDRLLLGGMDGFSGSTPLPLDAGRTSGAAFADLDADGDPDLVVTRNLKRGSTGAGALLLENDGGRFAKPRSLPVGTGARAIAVTDVDRDQRPDLVVVGDRFAGGSTTVLRNRGDLAFTDITATTGIEPSTSSLSVAAADLTGDGWADLVFAGDPHVYVAEGGGRFRADRVPDLAFTPQGDEDDAAGIAVGDLTGDGRADLVVGQHFNSTVDRRCPQPVRVFVNGTQAGGRARFTDVTETAGIPQFFTKSPHVELEDIDADGRLDIVTTAADASGQPAVLRNLGPDGDNPTFAAPELGSSSQYWVTGATGDFDRDGRIDIFVVENDPARPSLLLGNGSPAQVATVRLPAGAAGCAIEAVVDDGTVIFRRELVTGRGYAGGGPAEIYVGLGDRPAVSVRAVPVGRGRAGSVARVQAGGSATLACEA